MQALQGVHHAAFVTWRPEETIRFYRDVLGFPIAHCITAKGWGQKDHADFMHIFFDAGNENIIAFFYCASARFRASGAARTMWTTAGTLRCKQPRRRSSKRGMRGYAAAGEGADALWRRKGDLVRERLMTA